MTTQQERFDIVDEHNHPIGATATRFEVHTQGHRHRVAHIWIYNDAGQILIQRRSLKKDTYPGSYHVAASGHIEAGDYPLVSAMRELAEELSIYPQANEMELLCILKQSDHVPAKNLNNKEFVYVYLFNYNGDITKLTLQEEEVDSIRWIEANQIEEFLDNHTHNKDEMETSDKQYHELIVRAVKNRMKIKAKHKK